MFKFNGFNEVIYKKVLKLASLGAFCLVGIIKTWCWAEEAEKGETNGTIEC